MVDLDLDTLEALAKAASPSPWFFDSYSQVISEPLIAEHNRREDDLPEPAVCYVPVISGDTGTPAGQRDAAFIAAANPATILALIARIRSHDKGRDCARTEEVLEAYRRRALRAERALWQDWRAKSHGF